MHELAICEAVLGQVLDHAAPRGPGRVGRITLRIGPLAGVEPQLLRAAFPLVAAGTRCEGAALIIEDVAVAVHCAPCGLTSPALPNRLLCAGCGGWRVSLVAGDEMLLARFELLAETPENAHV